MKKSEFVTELAEKLGCTKRYVDDVLDLMLDIIMREVENGNDVHFYNFGTFSRKFRTERLGINPTNKEKLTIPAHYLPVFKPGEGFKKRVKEPT